MFGFEYWLARAKKGEDFAASIVWSFLQDAIKRRELNEDQWHVLAQLADAIKDPENRNAAKAVNRALSLGRGPGRKAHYQVEADQLALAVAVFDRAGVLRGDALAQACADVLSEMRIGANGSADVRAAIKAYRDHLPALIEIQQVSRENDATRVGEPTPDT